jgi:hypothetical protein
MYGHVHPSRLPDIEAEAQSSRSQQPPHTKEPRHRKQVKPSRINFLDLSREICDLIYYHV